MNDHCDREDYLFTTPHTYAPLGTTGRATYDTTYTLNCQRCGGVHHSPDGFALLCPRCQQLAALEAEIGRNDLAIEMLTDMHYRKPDDDVIISARDAAYTDRRHLITQWRKLHAEGAEGGE